MTYIQAISDGLRLEMRRDPRVFLLGEDVGVYGGAFKVTKGLLGAFIIEPKDKSKEPKFDSDYIMILNDTNIGLTINGRSFPGTGAIVAKLGEKVRIRFMNEGMLIHPMHLHGFWMNVITKDGAPLASPYYADVLNVAPGERYDAIVDCNAPGVWAFHCHILPHAESHLFTGTANRIAGCRMARIHDVTIEADAPLTFHVDGEPMTEGTWMNGWPS